VAAEAGRESTKRLHQAQAGQVRRRPRQYGAQHVAESVQRVTVHLQSDLHSAGGAAAAQPAGQLRALGQVGAYGLGAGLGRERDGEFNALQAARQARLVERGAQLQHGGHAPPRPAKRLGQAGPQAQAPHAPPGPPSLPVRSHDTGQQGQQGHGGGQRLDGLAQPAGVVNPDRAKRHLPQHERKRGGEVSRGGVGWVKG
jgi:hypothetical protein